MELTRDNWRYSGIIRDNGDREHCFRVSGRVPFYRMLLEEIVRFFQGGSPGVSPEDSYEVMSMLSAADRSVRTGKPEPVYPG